MAVYFINNNYTERNNIDVLFFCYSWQFSNIPFIQSFSGQSRKLQKKRQIGLAVLEFCAQQYIQLFIIIQVDYQKEKSLKVQSLLKPSVLLPTDKVFLKKFHVNSSIFFLINSKKINERNTAAQAQKRGRRGQRPQQNVGTKIEKKS